MIESLILWQLVSARADERNRMSRSSNGSNFVIFLMAVAFAITVVAWPFNIAARFRRTIPGGVLWTGASLVALFVFLMSPVFYVIAGIVWGMIELGIFITKNEDLFE